MDSKGNTSVRVVYIVLFLAVVITAGLLRYINLSHNPGWYSDEGTLVEIGKNLLHGKVQYLAFNKSTLLAARLPLFPAILAVVFSAAGVRIAALRWLTAGLGTLTVALLMAFVRNTPGERTEILSLAAGFCLAIYPRAVLFSRLGFSYNLLAPLVVGVMWAMYEYLRKGSRALAALAGLLVGLGTLSDLMIFTFIPALILIIIFKNWKDLLVLIPGSLLPFAGYALWMGLVQPEAFRFDFTFTFFRLGSVPWIAQYPVIAFNYASLIFKDYWWLMAVAGFFLLNDSRLKYLSISLFFLPLFALGRTAALPGLGFYYLIPFFPILALGAAAFLVVGGPYVFKAIRDGSRKYLVRIAGILKVRGLDRLVPPGVFLVTSLAIFVIVLSPFVITTFMGFYQAGTGLQSELDPVLVDVTDGKAALQYVNSRVSGEDLVIASPALAWDVKTNAADFQMALAYSGRASMHFPVDVPADRFAFDADYNQAAYVIIDPIWTNWGAVNMEGVAEMVREIEAWPLAFASGDVRVYQNPRQTR